MIRQPIRGHSEALLEAPMLQEIFLLGVLTEESSDAISEGEASDVKDGECSAEELSEHVDTISSANAD